MFFVDVIEGRDQQLIVRNRALDGDEDERVPTLERAIENDHVFPLLRGRDVGKWFALPSGAIVLPHDPEEPVEPIPFRKLGKKTQSFLTDFKEKLESRKKFRNFDPSGDDWYGLYSVLNATFAPYKVVWKEMAAGSVASVVSTHGIAAGIPAKLVIPDHKLMIIPVKSMKEAHFVAAILNSTVACYIVLSFAISTGISTHILDKLPIPKFDASDDLHQELARLSAECHKLASGSDRHKIGDVEELVDRSVAKLWDITREQTSTIRRTLQQFEGTSEED